LPEELERILYAEQQLIKVLPGMAEAATSRSLKRLLMDRFYQTEQHCTRLEHVVPPLRPRHAKPEAGVMDDVLAECEQLESPTGEFDNRDAKLLALGRILGEHEIAAYENAITLAEEAGHSKFAIVLRGILQDKYEAKEHLAS
jgi:ferritin-like metal-binding protein YciE